MNKLTRNIHTLEEYTASIKRQFWAGWLTLSEKEVDDYFNSDEVKNKIAEDYARDFERLQTGKITQEVFDVGCTSSVANCLIYMY